MEIIIHKDASHLTFDGEFYTHTMLGAEQRYYTKGSTPTTIRGTTLCGDGTTLCDDAGIESYPFESIVAHACAFLKRCRRCRATTTTTTTTRSNTTIPDSARRFNLHANIVTAETRSKMTGTEVDEKSAAAIRRGDAIREDAIIEQVDLEGHVRLTALYDGRVRAMFYDRTLVYVDASHQHAKFILNNGEVLEVLVQVI